MYSFSVFCFGLQLISDVWVIGDSIVFWAGRRCRSLRKYNLNLGETLQVRWQGWRGMRWWQLKHKIQWISLHRTPKVIIIHLGGNDVVLTKFQKMRRIMKRDFKRLTKLFPDTIIVWSEILPRLIWKYSEEYFNIDAVDIKRKRFNTLGRQIVNGYRNGRIIKHDITTDCQGFFKADGCHLSDIGIAMFCNSLQGVDRNVFVI